ncbi:MAG: S-methyl-5-thioribose-1-phosphate isomerase [Bacillota bacterium]|nr:S-methyl-5-thioribose-1-phosphate isomerase [Bacillota bacterium]
MLVNNVKYKTIWMDEEGFIKIIDQRYLPHEFVIEKIRNPHEMAVAIKDMHLRGAGLIGAAAGYGVYLSALQHFDEDISSERYIELIKSDAEKLRNTRPTAVNLEYALTRQMKHIKKEKDKIKILELLKKEAQEIALEDETYCKKIGEYGSKIIEKISKEKNGETVNILTHCNAGWLAFVDYGTATSPIYEAHNKGIKVHVWVDETRPRNQGARLTAWELGNHGVNHTVIADNAGGHLMQKGLVDLVIVGSDRTTYTGDVANKIGTYLKALAAYDNKVPFYAALPSSTIDWQISNGLKDIPIEERDGEEVKYIQGLTDGKIKKVLITPKESKAKNFGFDVTPSKYVTGIITERGICQANEKSIKTLFENSR